MRFIFALLLSFLFIIPSWAATPIPAASDAKPQVTINPDNVKQLIETLESDTARTEFINNLKTLQQAQGKDDTVEENPAVLLSQSIGLETQTRGFLQRYHEFLAKNNLNATLVGKWAITLAAAVIGLGLIFTMRKASRVLRRKMQRFVGKFSIGHTNRFRLYARCIRYFGYFLVLSLFVYALSVIWDFSDIALFQSDTAANIFGTVINVVFVIALAAFVGELINGSIEYGIHKAHGAGAVRLRTLLPMIRTIIFILFFILFGLVLLSELGINMVPLLAGAGVISIAVGFGAQRFINDFLTGFTIILEDLFHVGDVVNIGGKSGVVEAITLRKVQLRDYDGAVYTVPFSEISVIANMTKDYSYYMMNLGVAYREDTDEVMSCMREVVEEMRNEPDYKEIILEPIDIAGVDSFADSAVIIKARIKTKPTQQWSIGREFNRRIKKAFDARGIEIPFPYQTVVFGTDKQGNAAPLPVQSGAQADKDHRQPQE